MGYLPGDPWAICDRCGFKYRISQTRKEYKTGLRVCDKCYDPPNPLDDPPRISTNRSFVRDARPEPEDVFREESDLLTPDDF